jgi:hypothetical protein
MKGKLNWQACAAGDRNAVINDVKDILLNSGGYLVNFQPFSDLALSLMIEIEEKDIPKLFQTLKSRLRLDDVHLDHLNPASDNEWLIFLHISFPAGRGDLETVVPEVPG